MPIFETTTRDELDAKGIEYEMLSEEEDVEIEVGLSDAEIKMGCRRSRLNCCGTRRSVTLCTNKWYCCPGRCRTCYKI